MNANDRKELQKAIALIEEAKAIIESIGEQEQEKYDNLSEGLQASERGQKFEESAGELSNAAESLDDVVSSIESATE